MVGVKNSVTFKIAIKNFKKFNQNITELIRL